MNEFDQNPEQAQLALVSNYEGRVVDLQEAARTLALSPRGAGDASEWICADRVYLLKMPCCLCVQTIYKNEAGGGLSSVRARR